MNELTLFAGCELPEPKLPDVFDYDASVLRMQDLRDKTGEGFRKLMEELWVARECLAVRTGRPRKVQSKGPKVRSWLEYLDAVGLARSSVHKWLTDIFPGREREITLPAKRLPLKLPNSSTSEPVMTPKEAAAGIKDQALNNAMDNPEWNGQEKEPESPDRGEPASAPDELNASICERLSVLKIKVATHPDQEKILAAQKLLSELFMLFGEG